MDFQGQCEILCRVSAPCAYVIKLEVCWHFDEWIFILISNQVVPQIISVLSRKTFGQFFYKTNTKIGGEKMKRKGFKIISISLIAVLLISGCSSSKKIPRLGIAQIVSHTSLNIIKDSMIEQLNKLGYKDGENIILDVQDAGGQQNVLNSIMAKYNGDNCDAIVAIATPTALVAANYAKDIPILFSAVSDPVAAGFMDDLNAPNKNISGTSDEVQVDQILDLALSINKDVKKVGFIYNASEANSVSNLKKTEKYCADNNLILEKASGANITELTSAFSVLSEKVDIIFAPNDNSVASSMPAIAKSAIEKKIPIYTGADSMVMDGGFATVGIKYEELGKETANMIDRVLKGDKISSIPVKVFKDDLTIFINEDTMNKLGITLPRELYENEKLEFIK